MNTTFVTASGTGVGKTFVTRLLIEQLRERGTYVDVLKPVVTGFDENDAAASDSGVLLTALGRPLDRSHLDKISPWRFQAPLSPDMAAAREGRSLPYTELVDYCRNVAGRGATLIEGVGGVLVPLDNEHTVTDWIAALEVPALLVTGSYLGAISHTLTAFEVLKARDIPVCGIIVSESESQPVAASETALSIERFSNGCPVVVVPRLHDSVGAPNLLTQLGLSR
ncbi:MAG: dethiobiotin synthase [Gammaproteobacteria bacterium]|nr:dethiobiotin synthase [Gammaproteobacteria bacterium]